jgi:hypothetical protein
MMISELAATQFSLTIYKVRNSLCTLTIPALVVELGYVDDF